MTADRLTAAEGRQTIRNFIERGTQPNADPAACEECHLHNTKLCTWGGCQVSAQQAVVELNGGRQPSAPKVSAHECPGWRCHCDDLTECAGCELCAARIED